jgi:hypothetical protein
MVIDFANILLLREWIYINSPSSALYEIKMDRIYGSGSTDIYRYGHSDSI